MATLNDALRHLRRGELSEGILILEELRDDSPDNSDILLNLGMAYSDLGKLDEAIEHLRRVCELRGSTDDHTALGVAYGRNGQDALAIEQFERALKSDPKNPHILKNLGVMQAKHQQYEEAVATLKRAHEQLPNDPVILYNIGGVYEEMNEPKEADRWFKRVIALRGESDFLDDMRDRARAASRRLAEQSLRRVGFRPDAMSYCLAALERFSKLNDEEVKAIGYDIAMTGQRGLDINDPSKTYRLKSLPGEFTGLQLVSYMYVAFQRINPAVDVGIDLSKEYEQALAMYGEERRGEERRGEERRGEERRGEERRGEENS